MDALRPWLTLLAPPPPPLRAATAYFIALHGPRVLQLVYGLAALAVAGSPLWGTPRFDDLLPLSPLHVDAALALPQALVVGAAAALSPAHASPTAHARLLAADARRAGRHVAVASLLVAAYLTWTAESLSWHDLLLCQLPCLAGAYALASTAVASAACALVPAVYAIAAAVRRMCCRRPSPSAPHTFPVFAMWPTLTACAAYVGVATAATASLHLFLFPDAAGAGILLIAAAHATVHAAVLTAGATLVAAAFASAALVRGMPPVPAYPLGDPAALTAAPSSPSPARCYAGRLRRSWAPEPRASALCDRPYAGRGVQRCDPAGGAGGTPRWVPEPLPSIPCPLAPVSSCPGAPPLVSGGEGTAELLRGVLHLCALASALLVTQRPRLGSAQKQLSSVMHCLAGGPERRQAQAVGQPRPPRPAHGICPDCFHEDGGRRVSPRCHSRAQLEGRRGDTLCVRPPGSLPDPSPLLLGAVCTGGLGATGCGARGRVCGGRPRVPRREVLVLEGARHPARPPAVVRILCMQVQDVSGPDCQRADRQCAGIAAL